MTSMALPRAVLADSTAATTSCRAGPTDAVPASPIVSLPQRRISFRRSAAVSAAAPTAITAAPGSGSRRGSSARATALTPPKAAEVEITVEDRLAAASEGDGKSLFRVTQVDAAEKKDFYPATVTAVADVAPGVRCITVDAEISREFVPIDKAYTKPGQTLIVRVGGSEDEHVAVASSAPFPGASNFPVLYKLRGDIPAGATKAPQYALSVRGPLELHVEQAALPQLFDLQPGAEVEVGAFQPTGMDLRPVMFISRFPTLLIFASGAGVATARALIEAKDVGSLNLDLRSDVRLYISAPTPSLLPYKDQYAAWGSGDRVAVRPVVQSTEGASWDGTVGDFATAFDEDDFEYDPQTTAAVICGPAASNRAALAVLESGGVPASQCVVWELEAASKKQ